MGLQIEKSLPLLEGRLAELKVPGSIEPVRVARALGWADSEAWPEGSKGTRMPRVALRAIGRGRGDEEGRSRFGAAVWSVGHCSAV